MSTKPTSIEETKVNDWIKIESNNLPSDLLICEWKHPKYGIIEGNMVWYGGRLLSEQSWWIFPTGGSEGDIALSEFTHYRKPVQKPKTDHSIEESPEEAKLFEQILKGNNQSALWSEKAKELIYPLLIMRANHQKEVDKAKQQWISVSEALPAEYQRVIIYKLDVAMICYGLAIFNGKNFLFDAALIGNEKVFNLLSDKPIKGVTHWYPLPENPTI